MNTHDAPRDPHDVRTLLVPLDGSAFSRRILDQVRRLFAPDRFKIALLHVAELPAGVDEPYHPAAVGSDYTLYAYGVRGRAMGGPEEDEYQRHALYEGDAYAEYREQLEQELERELSHFRDEGYEASATVHFGDPVEEIVAFARGEAIAAIAMATHGRTGLGRLLQGSVAQEVFARLDRPVPVLLLRPVDVDDAAATERTGDRQKGPGRAAAETTLAALSGTGTLTIRRRPDGSVEEATGTFTPADANVDLAPLYDAQRETMHVTYSGPILDPDEDHQKRRSTQVFITGIFEKPPLKDAADPAAYPRIDFAAGEIADGELVTQPSNARTVDEAPAR